MTAGRGRKERRTAFRGAVQAYSLGMSEPQYNFPRPPALSPIFGEEPSICFRSVSVDCQSCLSQTCRGSLPRLYRSLSTRSPGSPTVMNDQALRELKSGQSVPHDEGGLLAAPHTA